MRELQKRVRDYLTETLPRVAALLGEGWTATGHTLTAPHGGRFGFYLLWTFRESGMARVIPAWEGGYGDLPTLTVSATAHPASIARAVREELLPQCPEPEPHIKVRLSGAACRALGYLESEVFDDLPQDLAEAAGRLLAGERSRGFGTSYEANLTLTAGRLLLADWQQALDEREGLRPSDRGALDKDAQRLGIILDLSEKAAKRAEKMPQSHV